MVLSRFVIISECLYAGVPPSAVDFHDCLWFSLCANTRLSFTVSWENSLFPKMWNAAGIGYTTYNSAQRTLIFRDFFFWWLKKHFHTPCIIEFQSDEIPHENRINDEYFLQFPINTIHKITHNKNKKKSRKTKKIK